MHPSLHIPGVLNSHCASVPNLLILTLAHCHSYIHHLLSSHKQKHRCKLSPAQLLKCFKNYYCYIFITPLPSTPLFNSRPPFVGLQKTQKASVLHSNKK